MTKLEELLAGLDDPLTFETIEALDSRPLTAEEEGIYYAALDKGENPCDALIKLDQEKGQNGKSQKKIERY